MVRKKSKWTFCKDKFDFIGLELTLFQRMVLYFMDIKRIGAGRLAVIIVVLCLLLGISVMSSVPAGYTGILTTYGKVENEALGSGLHFKLPWQRVVKLDNRVQILRIAAGVEQATTNDTAETKDQQLVPKFEFEIQYQLNPAMSYIVYSNYGEDYAKVLLTSNALQFIKETFALYNAEEIVTAKGAIPEQIMKRLNEVTEPLGVNIVRVNMVTYDFAPEYTAILEQRALLNAQLENNQLQQKNETIAAQTQYDVAVKQAEKEAETQRIAAENANAIGIAYANSRAEIERINADNAAYVTRTKAEADRDARLAAAEAEKAELKAKGEGLNDYIIQQEFIEKWDGKLIPSFSNTGLGFTDYTDIIKQYLFNGEDGE